MNILVVDDHPIIVEGYINALSEVPLGVDSSSFSKAYNCEDAYLSVLTNHSIKKSFDIALIDMSLPSYVEKSILSGSDLALFIRNIMPNCKIIMITAHTEIIVVYEIYRNVKPDGFIIKNDITLVKLHQALIEIMKGNIYQSITVKNCINEIRKKEIMFEDYNRQILLYLYKGFKIKELESVVCLSTAAIEKRIARMKKVFEATDASDLVKRVIKKGFI